MTNKLAKPTWIVFRVPADVFTKFSTYEIITVSTTAAIGKRPTRTNPNIIIPSRTDSVAIPGMWWKNA